ncbi:MAG TPA: caspase family protein [Acetobacteraceae bacterium]|jgi:uncharacterized caspase-like protein
MAVARRAFLAWGLLAATAPLMCGRAWADQRRIALVVGNNHYEHVKSLQNAGNDARSMAGELASLGFHVMEGYDLSRSAMLRLVNSFTDQLSHYDVGVFYYSGHGVQMHGANWLIPSSIGGEFDSEADLADESVNMADIADRMAEANAKGFNLLIIDACRDNPFSTKTKGIAATRGLGVAASNGVMILYSAGSNETALDRLGPQDHDPNGVFTRALLQEMRVPGLPVRDMITRLRSIVRTDAAKVGHDQMPALYDEAVGDFTFTPGDAPQLPVESATVQTVTTVQPVAIVQRRPPSSPRPAVPRRAGPVTHDPNDICTSLGTC